MSFSMDNFERRLDIVRAATRHVLSKRSENPSLAVLLSVVIGVSVVFIWTVFTTVYLTNRAFSNSRSGKTKCYFPERLNKLDAVSPVSTLEEWWPKAKSELGVSDAVDNQFVCVICFDAVQPKDEIHKIECKHIYHRECLERWYLRDHFDCPLCHKTFYPEEKGDRKAEIQDHIWMV